MDAWPAARAGRHLAWRWARGWAATRLLFREGGLEPAPPAAHHPTQPLLAETTLETPLVRTDQAAFIARPLAEKLHAQLVERAKTIVESMGAKVATPDEGREILALKPRA